MNGHGARWLLFISVLGLAFLGQYYFARKPDYFIDGVLFYALAAVLFLVLVRPEPLVSPSRLWRLPELNRAAAVRAGLAAVGLLLGLAAIAQLVRPRDPMDYWPVFWTWVWGMTLFLVAFVGRPNWEMEHLRRAIRVSGLEWGVLLALLLVAFGLRAWRIDTIPWTLSGDEGYFGVWARQVVEGKWPNMFGTGHLSMPTMYGLWQGAWLKLVSDSVVGLRLPWAVVGTLSVLGAYLLVRRLFSRSLALLVAFLLATYHFHIHYSRLGLNNISDPFFMAWSLYFLVLGKQTRRRWAWVVSGLLAGLSLFAYTGSRQVIVVLFAVLVWAAITERGFWGRHKGELLALAGGLFVAAGPMLLLSVQHPDDFNARWNATNIFRDDWLAQEAARTGSTTLSVLENQFRKAFFAFNAYRDRMEFYGPSIPLMDFLSSVFFLLGFVMSFFRVREWRYAIFVIWFIVVIILGNALLENVTSSQRIVSSAIPAVFFVAAALREVAEQLRLTLRMPDLGRKAIIAALASVLALVSVRFYFGPYQKSWVYGSFNAEVATSIGRYLRDLPPGEGSTTLPWREYFFGLPRMYADFGSTSFIAEGVELSDVAQPLTAPPDFVASDENAVFVFLPERIDELQWVRRAFPNGQLDEVHRVGEPNGPLLFSAYRVQTR